jgi:hypothetical protein
VEVDADAVDAEPGETEAEPLMPGTEEREVIVTVPVEAVAASAAAEADAGRAGCFADFGDAAVAEGVDEVAGDEGMGGR